MAWRAPPEISFRRATEAAPEPAPLGRNSAAPPAPVPISLRPRSWSAAGPFLVNPSSAARACGAPSPACPWAKLSRANARSISGDCHAPGPREPRAALVEALARTSHVAIGHLRVPPEPGASRPFIWQVHLAQKPHRLLILRQRLGSLSTHRQQIGQRCLPHGHTFAIADFPRNFERPFNQFARFRILAFLRRYLR